MYSKALLTLLRGTPARTIIPCMTDKASKKKRPRDANKLAKNIVDIATGGGDEVIPSQAVHVKDESAVSLGRRGGLRGGHARALKLAPDARAAIARKAAVARWGKKGEGSEGE